MSNLINLHMHMFASINTQIEWDEVFDQPVENIQCWGVRNDTLLVTFKDGTEGEAELWSDGFDLIDWDSPLHARLERTDGDLDTGDEIDRQGDNVFDMRDELENLRRLARYVAEYPTNSNSQPDAMGEALDDIQSMAQAALANSPVPNPEVYSCQECDEGGLVYGHLIEEAGCPCCGNNQSQKFEREE